MFHVGKQSVSSQSCSELSIEVKLTGWH